MHIREIPRRDAEGGEGTAVQSASFPRLFGIDFARFRFHVSVFYSVLVVVGHCNGLSQPQQTAAVVAPQPPTSALTFWEVQN